MLRDLTLAHIATIELLQIQFHNGLQIITGETGAGKSLIIKSLQLLQGAPADVDMIRDGYEECWIEAVFEPAPNSPVWQRLHDLGISCQGTDVIIRRLIARQGSGRVLVNHQRASLSLLKQVTPVLMDITSQHDHVALWKEYSDAEILDRFLPDATVLKTYQKHYLDYQEWQSKIKNLRADLEDREREEEWIRFQLKDFEGVTPLSDDEETALRAKRQQLKYATEIQSLSQTLSHDLESSSTKLKNTIHTLSRKAHLDEINKRLLPLLENLIKMTDDVSYDVSLLERDFNHDGTDSETLESTLAKLERLKRKYGANLTEVWQKYDELVAKKERLHRGDDELHQYEKNLKLVLEDLNYWAEQLSAQRLLAKERLEQAILNELNDLGMSDVSFCVTIEKRDAPHFTKEGHDNINILLAPNKGLEARSLRDSASGGEMARIMLAIKSVLMAGGWPETCIFDEIDTGVSGAVVEKMSRKLQALSGQHQVIAITHHPSVAKRAHQHYYLFKSLIQERMTTQWRALNDAERVEELARLVGGEEITSTQRELAQEMLSEGMGKAQNLSPKTTGRSAGHKRQAG